MQDFCLWFLLPRRAHSGYRDKNKVEVDIIIENAPGDCFAIEVKAAASLNPGDFAGLKRFQHVAGEKCNSSKSPYKIGHA